MHRQDAAFENIDAWFKRIREKYTNQMQCGKGCTACCHGLFDISLADAVEVARGFQRLTYSVQRDVYSEAERLYASIAPARPDLTNRRCFPKMTRASMRLSMPPTARNARFLVLPENAGSTIIGLWPAGWRARR